MYIYVYLSLYVHKCVWIYMCVDFCVYVCMSRCTCVCMYVCMCVYSCKSMSVCMYMCVYILCVCIYMCVYIWESVCMCMWMCVCMCTVCMYAHLFVYLYVSWHQSCEIGIFHHSCGLEESGEYPSLSDEAIGTQACLMPKPTCSNSKEQLGLMCIWMGSSGECRPGIHSPDNNKNSKLQKALTAAPG